MGEARIRKQYLCPGCKQVVYTTVIRRHKTKEGMHVLHECRKCYEVFDENIPLVRDEDPNRGTYAP